MAPKTEIELINAVGEWASANFTQRGADWGMIEEIGEATHCILKQRQGIRGFDDPLHFEAKFGDALADAVIYLCDWCYMHKVFFKFNRNQNDHDASNLSERQIVAHLLQTLSQMILVDADSASFTEESCGAFAQRFATAVEYWAIVRDMDIRLLVADTWRKVSQRDWKKNPKTAGDE